MKRAILLGVIFILSLNMKAQITLENTYVNIQNDFELIGFHFSERNDDSMTDRIKKSFNKSKFEAQIPRNNRR